MSGVAGLAGLLLPRGMRATSRHVRALAPLDSVSTLGSRGVPIGPIMSGGGRFCIDHFELYARRDVTGVSDPNVSFQGELGSGKSATVKVYLRRQACLGRLIRIVDPKGEYWRLAESLGGTVIRLRRNGGVRLNPLESPDMRGQLLRSVVVASLPRPLNAREPALLSAALAAAVRAQGEPTLPGVFDALLHPTVEMAERVGLVYPEDFAGEARDVALTLSPLCDPDGALAGMFDGPTSPGIDFDAQCVVVDLSSMLDSASVGILISCAAAHMQAALDKHLLDRESDAVRPKTILLVDEAWRVFSVNGIGEWLQGTFKLARRGQQNITVFHRLSDMSAAGDDGSRMMKLAQGLLEDCQTHVLFRLKDDALENAARVFGLSETERSVVRSLPTGRALWKVGPHRFVVQTVRAESDKLITYTDEGMRV